jgi:hypothetical protein
MLHKSRTRLVATMSAGLLSIAVVSGIAGPQLAQAAPIEHVISINHDTQVVDATCGSMALSGFSPLLRTGPILLYTQAQCDTWYAQDIATCQRVYPNSAAARAVCYADAMASYANCRITVPGGGTVPGKNVGGGVGGGGGSW